MVVTKAQRPQPVVLDRMSVSVAQEAIEASAVCVINSDLPTSGIADQQVVTEKAEVWWRKCHTPGRIEPRTVLQPLQQLALRREFVHESEAREVEVVVLCGVLLSISHIQIPVDLLDVERSKTLGDFFVLERLIILFTAKTHGSEVGVVNLDTTGTEIRDVEEKRSGSSHLRNGRTFVHGTRGGIGLCGVVHYHECIMRKIIGIDSRPPSHNRAVFGDKGEYGHRCFAVRLKHETRCRGENYT